MLCEIWALSVMIYAEHVYIHIRIHIVAEMERQERYCWPTHVTSLPNENEAIRFRFLTPTTRRVFLQVSCDKSFWTVWTAGPTGRGRRAVLRGTRGVVPVIVYPSHWRRRWTIGTRCQFYFLEDGSPRDLKPVRQTDLRLSILDFVQTIRSLFFHNPG